MSQTDPRIRDFVEARAQPTVVRLQDLQSEHPEWLSESFILTAEVRGHLEVFERAVLRELAERLLKAIGADASLSPPSDGKAGRELAPVWPLQPALDLREDSRAILDCLLSRDLSYRIAQEWV